MSLLIIRLLIFLCSTLVPHSFLSLLLIYLRSSFSLHPSLTQIPPSPINKKAKKTKRNRKNMKIIYLLSTLFLSTFGLSRVPNINENVELVNAGNGIFNLNVPANCHMAIRCENVNPGPIDIPRPPRFNFTDLTSTTPPRDTTTTTPYPKVPVINSQSPSTVPTRHPTHAYASPTHLPTPTTVSPTLDVVSSNKTRSPAPTVSIRYDIDPFRALELNRHFNYKEYICHGNDRHISGCAQGRIAEFLVCYAFFLVIIKHIILCILQ